MWFLEFRWLYYNEQNVSVFCFICVQQNAKLNLRAARNKELAFISEGFSNWKKALTRFKEHQLSNDAAMQRKKNDGVKSYLFHQSYRMFAISCPARTGHAG